MTKSTPQPSSSSSYSTTSPSNYAKLQTLVKAHLAKSPTSTYNRPDYEYILMLATFLLTAIPTLRENVLLKLSNNYGLLLNTLVFRICYVKQIWTHLHPATHGNRTSKVTTKGRLYFHLINTLNLGVLPIWTKSHLAHHQHTNLKGGDSDITMFEPFVYYNRKTNSKFVYLLCLSNIVVFLGRKLKPLMETIDFIRVPMSIAIVHTLISFMGTTSVKFEILFYLSVNFYVGKISTFPFATCSIYWWGWA